MSASNKRKYMVVRIELKDNVTWSDGTPLTVQDVVYSYDLCANYAMSGHAGATVWASDLKHRYEGWTAIDAGIFAYDDNPHEYPINESEKDTVLYLHVDTVLGSVASLFSTILILPQHLAAYRDGRVSDQHNRTIQRTDPRAILSRRVRPLYTQRRERARKLSSLSGAMTTT